jgi:hypothetical protein
VSGVEYGTDCPEFVRDQVVRAQVLAEEFCAARKRAGLPLAVDLESDEVDVHVHLPNEYNVPLLGAAIYEALHMVAEGSMPTGRTMIIGVRESSLTSVLHSPPALRPARHLLLLLS